MSEKIRKLREWVEELCPGENSLGNYATIEEKHTVTGSEGSTDTIRIRIFTDNYKYAIVGIDRDEDDGYLGCVRDSLKMLPGESWTRGRDLADGKFNRSTWDRILRDIVRSEIRMLSPYMRSGRPALEVERIKDEVFGERDSKHLDAT